MKVIKNTLAAVFAALMLVTAAVHAADESSAVMAEETMAVVNLNTATAEEMAEVLDGVGAARAALIVQYREEKGGISSVEELLEIKGIGMATLEKNRDRIQL